MRSVSLDVRGHCCLLEGAEITIAEASLEEAFLNLATPNRTDQSRDVPSQKEDGGALDDSGSA